MIGELQETLDELGMYVRGECEQGEVGGQKIKTLAAQASTQLEESFQEQRSKQSAKQK